MSISRRKITLHGAAALATAAMGGCTDRHSRRNAVEMAYPDIALPTGDDHIPLWPDTPPGGGGPQGAPRLSHYGAMTHIATPIISVHRPARPNGAAVIVAAGGGYRYLQMMKEAVRPAEWLNSLGITAFILIYRLPDEGWKVGRLAPFQDAQRAIRLVRFHAATFGIDPDRIGALGFSAGGHLLGMCAIRPEWKTYEPVDAADAQSLGLSLTMLAYPVITLEPPYQRTATRRSLIGNVLDQRQCADWSVQTYVRPGDPPFFLVQAADDRISSPANTEILEDACYHDDVPVVRHLFPTGGHGFGMGRPGLPCSAWPGMAADWMRGRGFIA
ncbi:alpha/beta hydrolase [Acetobacter conturbans]|uniref:Prolyl oligopeptidase family serine peptidase n=1 Tax=Acetobacter conturbans TaxID=1737472 RepID=A0ABX0JYZ5_9PROT|nr:alpha/beta hydrolase [Acetobacter conturbans]NHN88696.1 prolyl oligopeptidase family serine peptidase [Acetobacter conturbans]